jgi:hypothetical protein
MPASSSKRQAEGAMNTLHLHFIHHFAVKSAAAVYADVVTRRKAGFWRMR